VHDAPSVNVVGDAPLASISLELLVDRSQSVPEQSLRKAASVRMSTCLELLTRMKPRVAKRASVYTRGRTSIVECGKLEPVLPHGAASIVNYANNAFTLSARAFALTGSFSWCSEGWLNGTRRCDLLRYFWHMHIRRPFRGRTARRLHVPAVLEQAGLHGTSI